MTRRRLGIGVTFGTSIRVAALTTAAGLGTLTGCAEAGARSDFVVRDSAGITIVENAAPGEAVPSWSLEDAPALVARRYSLR